MSAPVESPTDAWWTSVEAHRARLLRVARRRTITEQDAEDAVAEALLRAAQRPEIGADRLPAWLTTVTVRLCADTTRNVARERRRWARAAPDEAVESPEHRVCDRFEAAWLAERMAALPERQATVLRMRADGMDVAGAAESMGVSYRTAESLLARGRTAMRTLLTSSLAAVLVLGGRWFRHPASFGGGVTTAAAGTAVGAAGIAVFVAVMPSSAPPQGPPPESAAVAASAPSARAEPQPTASPSAVPVSLEHPPSTDAPRRAPSLPGTADLLPAAERLLDVPGRILPELTGRVTGSGGLTAPLVPLSEDPADQTRAPSAQSESVASEPVAPEAVESVAPAVAAVPEPAPLPLLAPVPETPVRP